MFVIFPADELILMTYGAAIPRISPRPTLDCLREPKVPIVYPSRKTNTESETALRANQSSQRSAFNRFFGTKEKIIYQAPVKPEPEPELEPEPEPEPETELEIVETPVYTNALTYDAYAPPQSLNVTNEPIVCTLPPIPKGQTPRSSLKRSTPIEARQGSLRSTTILQPPTLTQLSLPQQQQTLIPTNNDWSRMQPHQQPAHISRPVLEHSSHVFGASQLTADVSGFGSGYSDGAGAGVGGTNMLDHYGSSMERTRSRSPSIFLEPPSPTHITDPTQPILGPGWGRPMSPMDLPIEPTKSPTSSRSRLRPKLKISLGMLGRSSSSDQRESNRLREDHQLHVENPIFNSENLRQRNFDAFFESGEPVYKLQTRTPATAPSDSSMYGSCSPPALDKYAGVYDSSPRGRGTSTGGGLFARSTREDKLMHARSKSTDEMAPARDTRAASVSCDGGVPQKGDRCPKNTTLYTLIKLFTVSLVAF